MKEMTFSTYHEIVANVLRAAIRRYFKLWEDVGLKDEAEREQWASTIEQPRLEIVVLSAVLLESCINFYLCTKCDAARFKEIEDNRKTGSLFRKWTRAPKLFVPAFSLPDNHELAKDLRKLIDRRNDIVHSMPLIRIDGDNRHAGNEPVVQYDQHEFIGRSATLPFRLIDHLLHFDHNSFNGLFTLRTYAGAVANEFEGGQRRLEVRATIPKALIAEIMAQGHDREIAISCALRIGPQPRYDEDGKITVWLGLRKSIRLEPLKFFAAASPTQRG